MVTAGEFCNRSVWITREDEPLIEAARLMRDKHVGSLVVVRDTPRGRRPIGVVTDRDVVVHVLAHPDHRLDGSHVADAMSPDVVVAWEEEPLVDVLKRMRSFGVRRIPVVDADGYLAGLISFDDLVEEIADELHDLATLLGRERRREQRRFETQQYEPRTARI